MFDYGFGDTDGAAFLLKISGSFASLKSAGTVNCLSGNGVEAYAGDGARNVGRMIRSAGPMCVCLISLANNHAHSDRQTGEIAKIWHFRVGCIPNSDLIDWSCASTAAPLG